MPHRIPVSEIGEYIRHQSCQRRFKLSFDNRKEARKLPFVDRLFNTIDPVLKNAGQKRENEWDTSLQQLGFKRYQFEKEDSENHLDLFFNSIKNIQGDDIRVFGRELNINGVINDFEITGRIDFLIVQVVDGQLVVKIVECKASRRDKTYHRIQVCIYKILLLKYLTDNEIIVNGVRLSEVHLQGVVARIDEDTNKTQNIMDLPPLVLDREEDDVAHLLMPNGPFSRIIASDVESLNFQLNLKCDDCVFNVHCLSESSRLKKLELLSIDPTAVNTLIGAGISNLDQLAEVDLNGALANEIRNNSGFSYNLDLLKKKATARRKTLIGGDEHPDEYAVTSYGFNFSSQLPSHEITDNRLIRVYLAVDYDYVENRVVGISAHVTKSKNRLKTEYNKPDIYEVDENKAEHKIDGEYVIEKVSALWNGDYLVDNGVERQLISTFFKNLIDKIAIVASSPSAPIHFYVWSRDEIKNLVEACSRVDTNLLSHLNQLLGCRESLEQLIYSCLKDEVDKRFGLGWTGRGLSVVTSLSWFGERFYWLRKISGSEVFLDRAFTQDIFDFKTDIEVNNLGSWARSNDRNKTSHKFEIRSRFHDQITVPYWYAYWGELPDPESEALDPKVRNAIKRYNEAIKPGFFDAFLKERLNALRWMEERVQFKNSEIHKPLLNISNLASFHLGINSVRRAAIDFLRLDFNVSLSDWISAHILPPINRVVEGGTIPVTKVEIRPGGSIKCQIYSANDAISIAQLRNSCSFSATSFVRISPCNEDLHRGQTVKQLLNGGITAIVKSLDWDSGEIILSSIPSKASDYILKSMFANDIGTVYDFATIDESVSDFVSSKVETRLRMNAGEHINAWFDPIKPTIPKADEISGVNWNKYDKFLSELEIAPSNRTLKEDQRRAILESLQTRIHLLLGPPGTGKTMTTAIAVLTRMCYSIQPGQVILIAANTHMAVNNLLDRIAKVLRKFSLFAQSHGVAVPLVKMAKIDKRVDDVELDPSIGSVASQSPVTELSKLKKDAVVILGGTTSGVLKLSDKHGKTPFTTPYLVIDEASMIVLPHFLSLATLLEPNGYTMLAGDNRQLSPITAHDWEREDRPPVLKYQPFLSAYDAVSNLRKADQITNRQIALSPLRYTFRLPADIRDLISRLYKEDDVVLMGHDDRDNLAFSETGVDFNKIWQASTGVFLVVHNERNSRKSNTLESALVRGIIESNKEHQEDSIAIITPHRAQRTLLTADLHEYADVVKVIDTVERLQGGERPNVIVSATASDPSAIGANAEFILNLNRANVAFSRAQRRLVVVCSEELLNYIPAEVEFYNSSLLWKTLRRICSKQIGVFPVNGYTAKIFTMDRSSIVSQ